MHRLTFLLIFSLFGTAAGNSLLLPSAWSDIQFEEVSQHAGITRIGESWGNAWGDFNGDGYLDLWATNHKHKPSLYRNNGDGTFTDIIDEVWDANPHADTHGVAWADFDNDGDQDLIVLSGGGGGTNPSNPKHDNHFYVNENGTVLSERAAEFGIDFPLLRGRAPLWLDWNRDGRLDLVLTGRVRPDRSGGKVTPSLFTQTAHGFEIANSAAGFNIEKDASLAQLSDITGDGVMNLIVNGNPYPAVVYDIATAPFRNFLPALNIPKRYNVQDVALADFNGDLAPDAFLARGVYRSYIDTQNPQQIRLNIQTNMGEKGVRFKTTGNVRFEIYSVWATRLQHLKIGAAGNHLTALGNVVIDNTDNGPSKLSVFSPENSNERIATYEKTDPLRNVSSFTLTLSPNDPSVAGVAPLTEGELYGMYVGYGPEARTWTVLYHTMPSIQTNWTGLEAFIASATQIEEVEPINFSPADLLPSPQSTLLVNAKNRFQSASTFLDGRSVTAGDFDNDMDVDIYVVRSSSAGNLPNHLYENQGNGTFAQVFGAGGAEGSPNGKGQSVTMADYDRDGYLDLFVTNGRGAWPFNEGPDQLFRNIGTGNNWLQIDLEGTVSNRDGIGARIFATTPDGKTQLRENGGGIHWAQQDQKRIHFGLAQNEKVSELVIHWPSGIVQKLHDVQVNQVLRVVEAEPDAIPGDVNDDGQVNILDFASVVKHFGETPPTEARADVNGDGTVNILDLVWIIHTTNLNP